MAFDGEVSVNISPLTDCQLRVQVGRLFKLPFSWQAAQAGNKTLLAQQKLGFVSEVLHLSAGLVTFEVSLAERGECQVSSMSFRHFM